MELELGVEDGRWRLELEVEGGRWKVEVGNDSWGLELEDEDSESKV